MSLPPPSIQDHGMNPYVQAYTSGSVANPYAYTGADPYGASSSSPLQQYASNRQLALQQLQGGNLSAQERQMWQKYLSDLDQWFQKYGDAAQAQGGEWDPEQITANGGLYDGGMNGVPSPQFQDSSKVVYEKGTDFAWNLDSKESRSIYLYQQNIDLTWEFASGQVKIGKEFDSFLGKEVTVATVTDRDGKTHKVIMPNVKSLKTHTTDPSTQVITDASFNGSSVKLKNVALNATEEENAKPKGTPPTKVDGDKATWDLVLKDGEAADLTPFKDWKTMDVKVKGDVNIIPNGNEEYYTIDYQAGPPAQYIVKVYDDPTDRSEAHLKTTMALDADLLKSANFVGDKSRVEFLGVLGDPKDPHKINTENEQAKKLTCGDASGLSVVGSAASAKYGSDTPVDEVNGNKVIYNDPALIDATVHADYNDSYDTHEIYASGKVSLYGYTSKDTMKVVDYQAGPPPTWKIEIYKDGITDKNKPGFKMETVIVRGNKNTQVVLGVMDPSMVTYGDTAWMNKVQVNGNDGTDEKKVMGEEAVTVEHINQNATEATYNKNVNPTFTNNFDIPESEYFCKVDASGKITINPASQLDDYVMLVIDNKLVITVTGKDKDGKEKKITYTIDIDKAANVVIAGISPSQVHGLEQLPEKYSNKIVGSDGKTIAKAQDASGGTKNADEIAGDLEKNASLEALSKNLGLSWDDGNGGKLDYSFVYEFVQKALSGIAKGMKEGQWEGEGSLKEAMDYLNSKVGADGSQDEWLNNGYGALFMALYNTLGKTKLKSVFAKMNAEKPGLFDTFVNSYKPSDTAAQVGNRLNPWQGQISRPNWDGPDDVFGNHYWVTGGWGSDPAFTPNGELSTWQQVKAFIEEAAKGE